MSRARRLRRSGLVFLGALIAHAALLGLVATQSFRLQPKVWTEAEQTTPLTVIPIVDLRSAPAPKRRASRRPAMRRMIVAEPPPVIAAAADPARVAPSAAIEALEGEKLAAAGLPGGEPEGVAGGAEAGGAAGSSAAESGARYPINPGYWEVVEHWLVIRRTERYCVAPENIARFMAAPCNHIYRCAYPVQMMDQDSYRFQGVIWRPGERYQVHGGGQYSPTSLRLTVFGFGHWRMLPFAFTGGIDGRFLSPDCPPDAKRIGQK